jgi:hypothetical protein
MYSCVPENDERPLHVEHHRVQLAVAVRTDAGHWPGHVVQLGQAHRLRKAPGRVDGEDDDPPASLCRA